jgi:chromosome segregation ATPase
LQLENRIEGIRRSITILFDPLQKPIEKLLKLAEAKKEIVDMPTLNVLSRYLGDPVETLCDEQERLSDLQAALSKLQVILERNQLDLKPTRNRHAIKSIVEICDNNVLEPQRRDYMAVRQEMNQLLSSPTLAELAAQRQDLEKRLKEVERTMGKLSLDFSNTKNRRDEMLKRMDHLKSQIEETFEHLTDEKITIDFESAKT